MLVTMGVVTKFPNQALKYAIDFGALPNLCRGISSYIRFWDYGLPQTKILNTALYTYRIVK